MFPYSLPGFQTKTEIEWEGSTVSQFQWQVVKKRWQVVKKKLLVNKTEWWTNKLGFSQECKVD